MKYFISFFCLFLFLNASSQKLYPFYIEIKIAENIKASTCTIDYYSTTEDFSDTLRFKSSTVSFKGFIEEPRVGYVVLYDSSNNDLLFFDILITRDTAIYFIPNLFGVEVRKGGPATHAFIKIRKVEKEIEKSEKAKFAPLLRTARLNRDTVRLKKVVDSLQKTKQLLASPYYRSYLKENPDGDFSHIALRRLGSFLSYNEFKNSYARLSKEKKQWPTAKDLLVEFESEQKLKEGRLFISFNQQDSNGRKYTEKDFLGKYVLIDLWASWCVPCRAANPKLKKFYEENRSPQFEVVGVALERPNDSDKWKRAMIEDGLPWLNLTDYKYWGNEVFTRYGFNSVPSSLLIDKKGKIIGKDLSFEEIAKIVKG